MPFLTGAPVGNAGPTSQGWTTPYPHSLGERARDKSGNEYIFIQCVTAIAGEGTLVSIDYGHLAAPLLHTSLLNARVGIAQKAMAVGDGGWAQIYGVAFVQGNSNGANAVGVGSSTDATSLAGITSSSDQDAFGMTCVPQLAVTSPTGTLNFAGTYTAAAEDLNSLTSASSNLQLGSLNYIVGMSLLTAAQVSALPDAFIIARYPTVTSPVSAVSNTTGPVTLTTYVSGTAAGHIGGEWVVFLNYPVLSGNKTS